MDYTQLPFSVFDFFAIFLPGAIGTFGLYLFIDPTLHNIESTIENITKDQSIFVTVFVIFLVVFSYLLGHILSALSELLLEKIRNIYTGSEVGRHLRYCGLAEPRQNTAESWKRSWRNPDFRWQWSNPDETQELRNQNGGTLLAECIQKEFGVATPGQIGYTFRLILSFVNRNNSGKDSELGTYIAQATMFQSMIVAMTLLFAAILHGYLVQHQIGLVLVGVSGVIIAFLSLSFYYEYRRYKRMWVERVFSTFIVISKEKQPQ